MVRALGYYVKIYHVQGTLSVEGLVDLDIVLVEYALYCDNIEGLVIGHKDWVVPALHQV